MKIQTSDAADVAKSGEFRAGVGVDFHADGDLNDLGLFPHGGDFPFPNCFCSLRSRGHSVYYYGPPARPVQLGARR
jgi:hypothetical protein